MFFLPLLVIPSTCWAHQASAGRSVSWNESTSFTLVEQSYVVAVVGTSSNQTFVPSLIDASPGAMVQFYFNSVYQSLVAIRNFHPCNASSEVRAGGSTYEPREVSGSVVVEMQIDSSDMQYMFFSDLDFAYDCRPSNIFTYRPSLRSPLPMSGTSVSGTGCSGHTPAPTNGNASIVPLCKLKSGCVGQTGTRPSSTPNSVVATKVPYCRPGSHCMGVTASPSAGHPLTPTGTASWGTNLPSQGVQTTALSPPITNSAVQRMYSYGRMILVGCLLLVI